ncbi:MAG: hypothetical protein ABEI11_02265 [Haloarculaceae archaeon]
MAIESAAGIVVAALVLGGLAFGERVVETVAAVGDGSRAPGADELE